MFASISHVTDVLDALYQRSPALAAAFVRELDARRLIHPEHASLERDESIVDAFTATCPDDGEHTIEYAYHAELWRDGRWTAGTWDDIHGSEPSRVYAGTWMRHARDLAGHTTEPCRVVLMVTVCHDGWPTWTITATTIELWPSDDIG
jgi:hypothetical protein